MRGADFLLGTRSRRSFAIVLPRIAIQCIKEGTDLPIIDRLRVLRIASRITSGDTVVRHRQTTTVLAV